MLTNAEPAVSWMIGYLEQIAGGVDQYRRKGMTLAEMHRAMPLSALPELPPGQRHRQRHGDRHADRRRRGLPGMVRTAGGA